MSFVNRSGKLKVFSENINGKQVWYNVTDGLVVEPKTSHGNLAAKKHGLEEILDIDTPKPAKPVKTKKPKKPKKK